jgi:hypothetical protein
MNKNLVAIGLCLMISSSLGFWKLPLEKSNVVLEG